MDDYQRRVIDDLAAEREALHADHASSRPLSDDYEAIGLAGEYAFGEFCGQFPDVTERPGGDKGVDFSVWLGYTVDVKTAAKPYNLLHEKDKPFRADIYVLAEYKDGKATLLGWEWRDKLQKAPTRDFGKGVINHFIPAKELQPMYRLKNRLLKMVSRR